ncbi:MAG TPA: hypothetical protein PKH77_27620 [Anaerolineae bacterium]|nr:hypothetical protein [Anaerolineae bacterium]
MTNALTKVPYRSIADCPRCGHIPQKVNEDIGLEGSKRMPSEVNELHVVLDMEDTGTHRYASSTTRLLKCDLCGAYYYYNHYDDEGEYFMDPPCETLTVRRYDPLTARDFLERLLSGVENVLPNAPGQLTKAFVDNDYDLTTRVAPQGLDATRAAARAELDELNARYDALLADCAAILQRPEPNWHIQRYALETRFAHFVMQGDWASLSQELLHHPDPVIRIAAAQLAIGIGTGDAPVYDILHVTGDARHFLEAQLRKKARKAELVAVLLDLALKDSGQTLRYDHGYGDSHYDPWPIQILALYYLVVSASHGANLLDAIPALVGLLSPEKRLNYQVCWVLRTVVEKRKKSAPLILEELEALHATRKATTRIFNDESVKQLIEECRKRLLKVAEETGTGKNS